MDETDWLSATDPAEMIAARRSSYTGIVHGISDRRLRLFACGCCRAVWHLLTDPRSRRAVEVAERFADGEATAAHRRDAYMATEAVRTARWGQGGAPFAPDTIPDRMASWAVGVDMTNAASTIARNCRSHTAIPPAAQAALLREIVGNPFRPAHCPAPRCRDCPDRAPALGIRCPDCIRRWECSDAFRIARTIYHERRFDLMPVLADPLEEAGCNDEELLRHLRLPGPHCRGCWVIDLILGKE